MLFDKYNNFLEVFIFPAPQKLNDRKYFMLIFQLGGDASNHQGAPVPPIRSSSAQQSNNGPYQQGSRTVGRRTGPAPAPPIQRPSRPPPMRPPTQPPPPPPSQNSSGGRNASHPPPPPPPMQPQAPKVIMATFYLSKINASFILGRFYLSTT